MKKILSKTIFWFIGWKAIGPFEYPRKCVVIAAPHTSNWDFVIGRLYVYITGINARYLIKSSLFLPIIGSFFRWDGGIPVNRSAKNNIVDIMVAKFNNTDSFILGIAPEGTRSRVDRWKTGFYHIAYKANVPIVLVGLDFKNKQVGVINSFIPTGDIDNDIIYIREQFKNIEGKIPRNYNQDY